MEGHPPSWIDYVNSLVLENEVTGDDRVIVQDPRFIKKLSTILTETDPRVVSNYIGWRVAKSVMQYLNQDARDIRHEYKKRIEGLKQEPPRWKTCVKKVGFNAYSD